MNRIGRINLMVAIACNLAFVTAAQTDSTAEKKRINVSGFADVFYSYDFNQPTGKFRQPFLYNHNRHNEFNLNLGLIKVSLEEKRYRGNIALQAGTYVQDNYANEQLALKFIHEANAGVSLNKKNTIWLDAGIFASHIGFEGAVSSDNWTLTRSLLAENSPYYLAGAKLSYEPIDSLKLTVLICNGWQRIGRVQGNSLPSFGTQLAFKPGKKISFNWSTFIGTEDPDTSRRMRYFNNVYAQFDLTKKAGLILGFDLGLQQTKKGSAAYNYWCSPVLIGKYTLNDKWAIAMRGEYYSDPSSVIIPTVSINGFSVFGASLNVDYSLSKNVSCRVEGRWLNSSNKIFVVGNTFDRNNFFVTGSMAIRFSND